MIKANNKNALGAYFRNAKIQAAYFRGKKIWEHEHTWNNNTCVGCGVLRLIETSGLLDQFTVTGNANITFLDADNNKMIYDNTDGGAKAFNDVTSDIYISSGAENITNIYMNNADNTANLCLNGAFCPALSNINLNRFVCDNLTISGTSALTKIGLNYNTLKLLDISNCPGIVTQSLFYTDFNNLQINGGSNLQTINLNYGNVNGTIDLSTCPNVTTFNTFAINLGETHTTELLKVIGATKLVTLDISGYNVNTLDISGCKFVITADCTADLYNLNITGCTALKTLDCRPNHFTSAAVNAILAALVANGVTNGTADLRTGSNDERNTPTGQGLTDRQTLINRGWTIETTD